MTTLFKIEYYDYTGEDHIRYIKAADRYEAGEKLNELYLVEGIWSITPIDNPPETKVVKPKTRKRMSIIEIRKQLIRIVKESTELPEIVCIVIPDEKPYGGAYLPVYGFNTKHQNIQTKDEAIDLIKEYQKKDFLHHHGWIFDGGWRHQAYEQATA